MVASHWRGWLSQQALKNCKEALRVVRRASTPLAARLLHHGCRTRSGAPLAPATMDQRPMRQRVPRSLSARCSRARCPSARRRPARRGLRVRLFTCSATSCGVRPGGSSCTACTSSTAMCCWCGAVGLLLLPPPGRATARALRPSSSLSLSLCLQGAPLRKSQNLSGSLAPEGARVQNCVDRRATTTASIMRNPCAWAPARPEALPA